MTITNKLPSIVQVPRCLPTIIMIAAILATGNNRWSVNCSHYHEAKSKEKCQLVGYQLKLNFPSCLQTVVDLNTCLGACLSASGPFRTHEKMSEITTCCRVVEYQEIHVKLKCRYNENYFHALRSATKCSCGRC